jgi:hypothetical protein
VFLLVDFYVFFIYASLSFDGGEQAPIGVRTPEDFLSFLIHGL